MLRGPHKELISLHLALLFIQYYELFPPLNENPSIPRILSLYTAVLVHLSIFFMAFSPI